MRRQGQHRNDLGIFPGMTYYVVSQQDPSCTRIAPEKLRLYLSYANRLARNLANGENSLPCVVPLRHRSRYLKK